MIRKDAQGREWQLIEARQRPTYGPEFGYEPKERIPSTEFSPMAADCFHESMQAAGAVDACIRQIRLRVADATIERIRASGMAIELAGPSFVVKTVGKTLSKDDQFLLTMLKPEVILSLQISPQIGQQRHE